MLWNATAVLSFDQHIRMTLDVARCHHHHHQYHRGLTIANLTQGDHCQLDAKPAITFENANAHHQLTSMLNIHNDIWARLPTRGRPDTPYLCYARVFARGSLAAPNLLGVDWQ